VLVLPTIQVKIKEEKMISTVTTVTIAINGVMFAYLGFMTTILLILFLGYKEIVVTIPEKWAKVMSQVLNVGIVPMLLVFAFTVVMRVIEVLGKL
jgi:hypothetical protein